MELQEVKKLVEALSQEFGQDDDPYKALASLVEEVGEVAAEVNKTLKSGAKARQGKEADAAALQEELGDVLLSLFYLSNTLGIDLEVEMQAKYIRLQERFNLDL